MTRACVATRAPVAQTEESANAGTVLVVDDERGPRKSIRMVLERRFCVTTAHSGEQAIDVLRHQCVDVVILDMTIPGIGGLETFRRIREVDPEVPIIIVSAADPFVEIPPERFFTPSDWIRKPFDAARLLASVERIAEATRNHLHLPEPRHDYIQMLSHDIKNRLHVVLGFVQLLREGELNPGHASEALDVIESNVRQAAKLAANFLRAEESESGAFEPHKTLAALNEIIEAAIESEIAGARLKRLEVQRDLDSLPSVGMDVMLIRSALANLLGNAIQHSPVSGVVHVQTRRRDDGIVLQIRDHGPGIPADELSSVFRRYARGAKASSSTSTGLGLYLARAIVEAHGGSVSVSLPPDGGAAFTMFLPRCGL